MANTPAKRLVGSQQDATTTGKGINTRVPAATQAIRTGVQERAAKALGIHAQKGTKAAASTTVPVTVASQARASMGSKVSGATQINGGATN